jgi:hypothetical protein
MIYIAKNVKYENLSTVILAIGRLREWIMSFVSDEH